MTEAITIIKKQLQQVQNMIQGSQGRLDKLDAAANTEEDVIVSLKQREAALKAALIRLSE